MKYCGFCGANLQDEHKFCTECGKSVDTEQPKDEEAVQQNKATYESAPCVSEPISTPYAKPVSKLKYSIMGFAFGVGALISAIYCIIPILNLFVFLPAFIVFTALSKKYAKRHIALGNRENGFYRAAKIVSTVAIPIGCVFSFLGLVLFI